MYKPLLILKYLRRRRIAWVSLVAVMLCTAMVLVVLSVMSGWLGMFRSSFQGISGDVVVRGDGLAGFPYYEQIGEELEGLPEVTAAVPRLETFGLINVENAIQEGVKVVGLPLERVGEVSDFPESLFLQNPADSPEGPLAEWRELAAAERGKLIEMGFDDEAADEIIAAMLAPIEAWAESKESRPTFDLPWDRAIYRARIEADNAGRRTAPGGDAAGDPGLIVGTGVLGIRKDAEGEIDRWYGLWPQQPIRAKVLTLAVDPTAGVTDLERQKAEFAGWIVDNSRTGVSATDQNSVYVDFDYLQRILGMEDRQEYADYDPETGEFLGDPIPVPKRTHELHVALADGVDLETGRRVVEAAAGRVLSRIDGGEAFVGRVRAETWEERYSGILQAVEKERALVVTLFAFISVVAVFLILCIFYMIVQEKTRDIGIVKSVGATSGGIALVFLGYGGVIGVVGAGLGLGLGSLIVLYINEIHDLMGLVLGVQVWSADTYLFDKIPNEVATLDAAVIFAAAVVSSVVGAVVPAWRAASLRPVEALRFE